LRVRAVPPEDLAFLKANFTKFIPVLLPDPSCGDCRGVSVVATSTVADSKVQRVANVLAEFLDNDEDGQIDTLLVAAYMDRNGAVMVMFANSSDLDAANLTLEDAGYYWQDERGDETGVPFNDTGIGRRLRVRPDAARGRILHAANVHSVSESAADGDSHLRCVHRQDMICDAVLEEGFHLVTDTGFAYAYPDIFDVRYGSNLTSAMLGTIGDCGFNTTSGVPPDIYKAFAFPHCSGAYHYGDYTCEFECLATEYFHHLVASHNGEYAWGRADLEQKHKHPEHLRLCSNDKSRATEWEICWEGDLSTSQKVLQERDPLGFGLISNPLFRVPLRMPDGRYTPPPAKYVPLVAAATRSRSLWWR